MANAYFNEGIHESEAVFYMFFRKPPFGKKNEPTLVAGLETLVDFIRNIEFNGDERHYLSTLVGNDGKSLFNEGFIDLLKGFGFEGSLHAVPEGTIVFPHEPLVRVQGPLWQCQLIESALLNIINFQTLIATKAMRIYQAAEGDPVLEFGMRRAQGIDGALSASRAAYIGGCSATSNVLAGMKFGIPVKGTHAHSFVSCFDRETSAFNAYALAMPNNCTLLVDTYDTVVGIKNAIVSLLGLKAVGHNPIGIRLDSGDLCELSKFARAELDKAGLVDAKVVASNDLDEYRIAELKQRGAKIDVWGVGTRLVTAYDNPALGGVYKLSAIKRDHKWKYKMKLSDDPKKSSMPGILQVQRFMVDGCPIGDMIHDYNHGDRKRMKTLDGDEIAYDDVLSYESLLVPILERNYYWTPPSLHEIVERRNSQLEMFEKRQSASGSTDDYPVGTEYILSHLKMNLETELREAHQKGKSV